MDCCRRLETNSLVRAIAIWFIPMSLSGYAQEADQFSMEDYYSVEKIDIHCHIHTENTDFVALAKRDRFRFLNMAVQTGDAKVMEQKHRTTFLQYRANPDRTVPVSSFSMFGWDEPDWQEKTIRFVDETFEKGAVGVKVWKNIGMAFRDKNGDLVMIDDPQLDPIFAHLKKKGIVLIGHLGEPKNCWLPLNQMIVEACQPLDHLMQFFFGSSFPLNLGKIEWIYGSERHFCDSFIVVLYAVHVSSLATYLGRTPDGARAELPIVPGII